MQRCAFTPYEGKKPYIFISYAHKDSHRVFPILEELDRRGYRVWYDDGIAPGSEWPENIAQHLDGCSLTMAFVSPASIASPNCRREVTFALSRHKPFLGILLEPTEMSLGMEMQLSAQQCIMKYSYSSDQEFFSKVCSCPDLQPCLGQPKPPAIPIAPTPVVEPAPSPAPVFAPVPKANRPLNKKLLAIIGAVAGVALISIVLALALSGKDRPGTHLENTNPQNQASTPPGTTQAPRLETQLTYQDQTISAEQIAYLNNQTQLEYLTFQNCTFETGVLTDLALSGTLKGLTMEHCQGVDQLQWLSSLKDIQLLHLIDCNISSNSVPSLNHSGLIDLNISQNPDITDLAFLSGCTGLTNLDFSQTKVSNIQALASMEALIAVNGSQTEVSDIAPLADLTKLEEIRFSHCRISQISKPFLCLHLRVLDLASNDLQSLEAFENCAVLEEARLGFNQLDGTYPISKSAATLTVLDLSGNENISANSLTFLKGTNSLERLYLDGINLFDLDLISHMTNLAELSAASCHIDDIDGLANTISQLTYLNLSLNSIDDLNVLSGLCNDYMILDISYNPICDLSPLPTGITFSVLNIASEYLDLSTTPALNVQSLILAYSIGMEESDWLKSDPCWDYIIIDCPLDKVVFLENLLGSNDMMRVSLVEEYVEILSSLGIDVRMLEIALQES